MPSFLTINEVRNICMSPAIKLTASSISAKSATLSIELSIDLSNIIAEVIQCIVISEVNKNIYMASCLISLESKRFLNASLADPPSETCSLLTLLMQYRPINKPIIRRPKVKKANIEIFTSSGPPSIGVIEKLLAIYFDSLEPKAAPNVPPNEINPKYFFALFC